MVQPHRYTRLKSLFEEFCTCFNDADSVIVAPVFTAGEELIVGAGHDDLAAGLRAHGHKDVDIINGQEDLAVEVSGRINPGDVVICLGAGTITKWAHDLPKELEKLG